MLSTKGRFVRSAAALTIVGMMIAGCGSSDSSSQTGDGAEAGAPGTSAADKGITGEVDAENGEDSDLVTAAKKEGEVTFEGIWSDDNMQVVAKAFEEKYGISVTTISSTAEKEVTDVNSQLAGDALQVDVLQISLLDQLATWEKDGVLATDFELVNADEINPSLATEGAWYPLEFVALGLAYNTDRLTESEIPSTWEEFLNGSNDKAKLSTSNPNSTGIPAHEISMLQDLTDSDVIGRMAETYPDTLVSDSSITALQFVVTGEADICFSGAESYVAAAVNRGEPVSIVYPKGLPDDGVLGQANFVTLLDKAPHPNAARLFLQYLMSMELQTKLAEIGIRGTLSNLPAPAGAPDISDRPFITPDYEYYDEHADQIKDDFSRAFKNAG